MAYTTITDPSAHFHTQLYTGNGTAIGSGGNAITNNANSGNFKPDWIWHKVRSTVNDHQVYDSTRGVKIRLNPNANNSEFTLNEGLQSFDTNGFTVGSDNGVNQNSQTFVAWQWVANGGTTTTNTDGSENSTVQVNSTAGFSIVKRTGTGSAGATYGHGLGAVPDVIINKGLNTNEWYSYFKAIGGGTHWIDLSGTGAAVADANMWNNTDATSTVFTVGNSGGSNGSGVEYINYCFKEVQGYSKFGSYTGNGNADGPFVYTGFKPAWVMIRRTDAVENWIMLDNKREPFNVVTKRLYADTSGAESTSGTRMDFVSNGFKLRQSVGDINTSGGTYIYMAFAENPLVASNNVIALAR